MDACCVYVDSILHLLLHVCLMCVVISVHPRLVCFALFTSVARGYSSFDRNWYDP